MGTTSTTLGESGNVPCVTHSVKRSLSGSAIIESLYLIYLVSVFEARTGFSLLSESIMVRNIYNNGIAYSAFFVFRA